MNTAELRSLARLIFLPRVCLREGTKPRLCRVCATSCRSGAKDMPGQNRVNLVDWRRVYVPKMKQMVGIVLQYWDRGSRNNIGRGSIRAKVEDGGWRRQKDRSPRALVKGKGLGKVSHRISRRETRDPGHSAESQNRVARLRRPDGGFLSRSVLSARRCA